MKHVRFSRFGHFRIESSEHSAGFHQYFLPVLVQTSTTTICLKLVIGFRDLNQISLTFNLKFLCMRFAMY